MFTFAQTSKNLSKIKKFLLVGAITTTIISSGVASASPLNINKIGTDKIAHAGVNYILVDQFHRNLKMNRFWASAATLGIGAIRELSHGPWDISFYRFILCNDYCLKDLFL